MLILGVWGLSTRNIFISQTAHNAKMPFRRWEIWKTFSMKGNSCLSCLPWMMAEGATTRFAPLSVGVPAR